MEKVSIQKRDIELVPADVSPTIIIGLGGTGKEVLLRIRRLFYEKYGNLDRFPIVSYLLMDAEKQDIYQSDLARKDDKIIKKIEFTDAELIWVNCNPGQYIQKIHTLDHIRNWFYAFGELKDWGDNYDGCGQIRPCGRLSFFHNYEDIRGRIQNCYGKIKATGVQQKMSKLGIKVNMEQVNVYIICSVAGGTGSGMYLDTAFLIKSLYPEKTALTGFLVLPKVFSAKTEDPRVWANAYSALKELDFYKFANLFHVQWGQYDKSIKLLPPPFAYCFLIDGVNKNGMSFRAGKSGRDDLYSLVAENIFQDFSGDTFAGKKRGVRINLNQYMLDLFVEPYKDRQGNRFFTEPYTCRYDSFGLSSIYYPADRIRNACANKLAREIIRSMGSHSTAEGVGVTDYVQNKLFPAIGLVQGEFTQMAVTKTREDVLTNICKSSSPRGSLEYDIDDYIFNNFRNKLKEGVPQATGIAPSQYIKQKIEEYKTQFKIEGMQSSKWGAYIKEMDLNKKRYLDQLKKDIQKHIWEIANDPDQGLAFAIQVLREIRSILTDKARKYRPWSETLEKDKLAAIAECNKRVQEIINDLKEHEGYRSINPLKKATIQHDYDRLMPSADSRSPKVLRNYFWFQIERRAHQLAQEVYDELLDFIGEERVTEERTIYTGLILEINSFIDQLKRLEAIFEGKYQFFRVKLESPLKENLYQPDDIENEYYPNYMGRDESEYRNKMDNLRGTYLMELCDSQNVLDLIRAIQKKGLSVIEEQIINLALEEFRTLPNDYFVLDMFYERYDSSEIMSKLLEVYNAGLVWIQGIEKVGTFKLDPQQQKYFVSLADVPDNPNLMDFKEKITSNIPHPPEFEVSGDKTTIFFYSEVAGYPLFYLKNLGDMLSAYDECRLEGKQLHTDKNEFKFLDLIPMTEDEREELVKAYRAFLLGTILGFLNPKTTQVDFEQKNVYIYRTNFGKVTFPEKDFQLGVEDKVVDSLIGKRDLLQDIIRNCDEKLARLRKDNRLAEYAAILHFFYDNIYPLKSIQMPGGEIQNETGSIFNEVINKELENVETMVDQAEQTDFEDLLNQLRDHLDDFSEGIGDTVMIEIEGIKRPVEKRKLLDPLPPRKVRASSSNPSTTRTAAPAPTVGVTTNVCAGCNKPVRSDFKRCPYCQKCPQCGREMEPEWEACPFHN